MDPIGHYSNPSSVLSAALGAGKATDRHPRRSNEVPRVIQRRLGNGVVQRAIISVFEAAGRPMRVAEVHRGVEETSGFLCPEARSTLASRWVHATASLRADCIGATDSRPIAEITACEASRSEPAGDVAPARSERRPLERGCLRLSSGAIASDQIPRRSQATRCERPRPASQRDRCEEVRASRSASWRPILGLGAGRLRAAARLGGGPKRPIYSEAKKA